MDHYFKTTDLAYGAYLASHKFKFLGSIKTPSEDHPNQVSFVFEDSDQSARTDLEEKFRTGRADKVSAKQYSYWMRKLGSSRKDAVDPGDL